MLDRLDAENVTYSPEVAMAVQAMRARNREFYARLDEGSKPFGVKLLLMGAALGFGLLGVSIALGVLVAKLLA